MVNELQSEVASIAKDEEILGYVEPTWWSWFWWLLIGLATCWLLVGLVIWYLVYRAKQKSGSIITDKRIIQTRAGLLSDRTDEVWVRGISTTKRFFGGGYVTVYTGAVDVDIASTDIREVASVIRSATSVHK